MSKSDAHPCSLTTAQKTAMCAIELVRLLPELQPFHACETELLAKPRYPHPVYACRDQINAWLADGHRPQHWLPEIKVKSPAATIRDYAGACDPLQPKVSPHLLCVEGPQHLKYLLHIVDAAPDSRSPSWQRPSAFHCCKILSLHKAHVCCSNTLHWRGGRCW